MSLLRRILVCGLNLHGLFRSGPAGFIRICPTCGEVYWS